MYNIIVKIQELTNHSTQAQNSVIRMAVWSGEVWSVEVVCPPPMMSPPVIDDSDGLEPVRLNTDRGHKQPQVTLNFSSAPTLEKKRDKAS